MMVFGTYIYAYTQITLRVFPREKRKRKKILQRRRKVLGRPRIHNRLKLYLYMLHTHIHRRVKAGTTWLCLSWETILHGAHVHAVLLSTPHQLSFAELSSSKTTVLLPGSSPNPSRFPEFRIKFPLRPRIYFFLYFTFTTIKDACLYVYASHLLKITRTIFLSPTPPPLLPLRQFLVHVTVIFFAAHDVHILSRG